jgi:N utilization substance protein B
MAERRRSGVKTASDGDSGDLEGARILIVEARFYEDIADALFAGAIRALQKAGAVFERVSVPGSLEVPPAIAMAVDAAERLGRPYDGAVALGCVIRGETLHFEIVSQQSARALLDLSIARRLPIGNGILTVDTSAPAWTRARPEEADKGGDAARAALSLVRLKRRLATGCAMARNGAPKDERKANRRGAARLAAVQALYQMDIAGTGLNEILAEFESHWIGREVEGAQYLPAEGAFFRDVVSGVVREQRSLDPLVDKVLSEGWPLKRIEAILRAVLRAGAYELGHRSDVPARVVVSEYVDVANAFVDKDETGMVNAVLDRIARQFRAGEFSPLTR